MEESFSFKEGEGSYSTVRREKRVIKFSERTSHPFAKRHRTLSLGDGINGFQKSFHELRNTYPYPGRKLLHTQSNKKRETRLTRCLD